MKSQRPWESHAVAASVVLISKSPNWKDEGIVTLRITDGEELQARSPYQMELLAVVASLYIQQQLHTEATTW